MGLYPVDSVHEVREGDQEYSEKTQGGINMNPHILSTLERRRILDFNEDQQETPAIRTIRSRTRKNLPRLMKDIFLISLFLGETKLARFINDHIDWEDPNGG